ncbi:ATP-binding cassette domain-containing protein [Oenococcus kitaharae]|nr:ABC transporter ATP-binding protein [Oenococcus kitaharae]
MENKGNPNKNLGLKWVLAQLPVSLLILIIIFAIIASLEGVISGYAIGQITAIATTHVASPALFVLRFVLIYFAVYTGLYIFILLQNRAIKYLNVALKQAFMKNAFQTDYVHQDADKLLNQVTADAKQIEQRYFSNLVNLLLSVIAIITSSVFVIAINPMLGLIDVILSFSIMIPTLFDNKKLDQYSSDWSMANQHYLGQVKEIFAGIDIIKNFRAEKTMLAANDAKLNESENRYLALNNRQFFTQYFSWLMIIISFLGPVLIGLLFRQYQLFGVTISAIVTLALSGGNVATQVRTGIQYYAGMKTTRALRQSVIPDPTPEENSAANLPDKPLLSVADVSFSYKNHPILKDVSLSLPYGGKLLLSGDSGSGKSTFLNLLTNKLDVQTGSITLGGQQIHENDFAYITQTNWVFNDTVKENLTLGQNFSNAALLASLKEVNLANELGDDPLNYQCGEGGKNLSGGQKQRIAIARALLRKRPLLLLDEVTAALDEKNSEKLRDLIYRLPQTIIEIAHHYDTDQIQANHVQHLQLSAGKISPAN